VPDSPPTPARRRERAIRLTVGASVGAKAFSVLCTFAQVPIALRFLGPETYGFWVTLLSVVLILNTFDFGLGVGIEQAMAKAYGTEASETLRQAFWTGTVVLTLLGLVVFIGGAGAARFLPWADLLHVHDATLRSETAMGLTVAVAAFSVGLPFNAVARLAAAVQRGWLNALWIAVGSAVSLALVAAAAHWHWGFTWFLCASLLVPSLQGIGLAVHLFRALGWQLRLSRPANAAATRLMLRSSGYFAFPQFGLAFVQSAPALAISIAAGPVAVTAYNLLMRLFSPFLQGQLMQLTPVWPAYTEAAERRDHPWIERTYWRTIGTWAALSAALAVTAWQAPRLLDLWVGRSAATVPPGLAAVVAAWCILQMAVQPFMYHLKGIGELRLLAWWATPGFLLTAIALFVGSPLGTAEGVLGVGSAALAITLIPPLVWLSLATVRRHRIAPA
jgi:O-antigen/teichoic acid export membrane protein